MSSQSSHNEKNTQAQTVLQIQRSFSVVHERELVMKIGESEVWAIRK